MKKFLAILMVMLMTFGMAACGGGEAVSDGGEAADSGSAAETYKIGVCQLVEHVALDSATQGFIDAVNEGLGDAVDIKVELAQGEYNNCATIVNSFVASDVDLIMANATGALQAAVAGTADIPILGTSITAYDAALGTQLVDGCVGGNVSGTSDLAPLDAQAEMLQQIFPDAKTVGILYCSSEANSAFQVDVMTAELAKLGITAQGFPFSDSNDLASVATNAVAASDVIYLPTDNTVASNTGIIENICSAENVPVVTGEEGPCAACGTVTITLSYYDIGYKTGEMAVDILKNGADISTMPIEYAPEFVKKYEPSHCEKFGLEIPDDFVAIEQ